MTGDVIRKRLHFTYLGLSRMSTRAPTSKKALAALDPAGSYGHDLVVIQGLVSPNSPCAWKGTEDGYDTHCFSLAAWRKIGGPVVMRELYVQRPIRKSRDWPGVFLQHTI